MSLIPSGELKAGGTSQASSAQIIVSMSLIPSGELKDACFITFPDSANIVSMSLIPSGELKVLDPEPEPEEATPYQ